MNLAPGLELLYDVIIGETHFFPVLNITFRNQINILYCAKVLRYWISFNFYLSSSTCNIQRVS